ncbi:pirin family protein [Glaciimonas sp. CA11.2]|uniref:pirin family protein n=1 Tax=Glaciimonas sp. CA11.2 TaxID=3048601 RepID=UPI002AB50755|nr:pirin family protein [Glaciimonas sp. CA11.2]MDY7545921.1 pirin family protein [Glaciimonas sp. CA11.2]MEB0161420.1 pirin family protein [Glaciimonas sp. CA11.2]
MKTILGVLSAPRQHWVGDGFPVRSLFSFDTLDGHLNPFLLLDYAGPAEFAPTEHQRGVGQHPHRGFETVTIVYEGEVAHRDSTGNGGVIGPGDVQWMTAASGILHEEFHAPEFSKKGGAFEMVQLWINLPAKDKMAPPGYQGIINKDIPVVSLADDAGTMRVIAGEFNGAQGPAHTFTPINVWDVRLRQNSSTTLPIPTGHVAAVVVLHGTILVNGAEVAREAQVVLLDRDGDSVLLEANSDATLLLLSGAPLDEPVFAHGPFVMNTREEIVTAMQDFNSGRFGEIAPATS